MSWGLMMTKGEKATNLVLLCAWIVFFFEAQRIPPGLMIESVRREVGADFWPKALLLMLFILTAVLNLKCFLLKRDAGEADESAPDAEKERWWNFLFLVLAIIIYLHIQYIIGFITSTFLFVFSVIFILGYRKKVFMIGLSIVIAFLFAVVFGKFLGVPFPRGYGLFRSFEYLIY